MKPEQQRLQDLLDEFDAIGPLFLQAVKRKLDAGEELLVLKHRYDLSAKEIEQILNLYEVEEKHEQR